MAMPTMSSYCASKFALEGASESLWYEMKPWGIHVTLIVPGFINSEGYKNTKETSQCVKSCSNPESTYHHHYNGMKSLIDRAMTNVKATNESVAELLAKSLKVENPPLRIHVTKEALLLHLARKALPAAIYHSLMYRLLPDVTKWGKSGFEPAADERPNVPRSEQNP